MLYRTGLRRGEALALQLEDIDFEVCSVTVWYRKGDRRRTVGIDPRAGQVVQAWIRRRHLLDLSADAPLFCGLHGGPMSQPQVRTMLHRLARRAGIDKRVHPHGLRHTHAYELMMEGVVVAIRVQRQLGRASLATTDNCLAHIAPEEVIETIGKRQLSP